MRSQGSLLAALSQPPSIRCQGFVSLARQWITYPRVSDWRQPLQLSIVFHPSLISLVLPPSISSSASFSPWAPRSFFKRLTSLPCIFLFNFSLYISSLAICIPAPASPFLIAVSKIFLVFSPCLGIWNLLRERLSRMFFCFKICYFYFSANKIKRTWALNNKR